jgi:outer membrane protein assembly factor BamB
MKVAGIKKLCIVLIIGIVAAVGFSCKDKEEEQPPVETAEEPASEEGFRQPTKLQGLVTFFSGDVELYDGSEWAAAEIGETVEEGYAIKTFENSSCEIQFGKSSIIQLKENTDLTFSSVLFDPGNTNVELKLSKGTLLSKVEKLTVGDSYNVTSPGAICGIRGTQFLVSMDEEQSTTLAVREGKVSLVPLVADAEKLELQLSDSEMSVKDVFKKAVEAAPVISDGEEVTLQFAVIEPYAITNLDRYAADATALQAEIASRAGAVLSDMEALRRVAPDNEKMLEEFAGIEYIGVDQAQSEEEAKILDSLERLRVKSAVSGATLTLNGAAAGADRFSALLPKGATVTVAAYKEGYKPAKKTVTIEEGMDEVLLELEKEEEKEAAIPSYQVEVSVQPPNARIFKDGDSVGTGTFTGEYKAGEKLTFSASADTYSPRSITFTVTDRELQKHTIVLPKTLERVFRVSFQPLVGELAARRNIVYAADAFGVLSAYTIQGDPVWKVSTGNSPNEYSFPIYGAENVFLSGSLTFYIVNAADGSTVLAKELTGPEMHLFGRHVAIGEDFGFYPANEYIDVFKPATGESMRQIAVRQGLRMTPALYREQLLVVNTAGEFISFSQQYGSEVFAVTTGSGQPIGTDIVVDGNTAYFIDKNGVLTAVDLAGRNFIWQSDLSQYGIFSVLDGIEVGSDGIYAYSQGTIVGVSRGNGKPLFPAIQNATSPPGYHNGNIYYGTPEKLLQEVDAVSGTAKRRIFLDQIVTTRPVMDNGKMFVGTKEGMTAVINP